MEHGKNDIETRWTNQLTFGLTAMFSALGVFIVLCEAGVL